MWWTKKWHHWVTQIFIPGIWSCKFRGLIMGHFFQLIFWEHTTDFLLASRIFCSHLRFCLRRLQYIFDVRISDYTAVNCYIWPVSRQTEFLTLPRRHTKGKLCLQTDTSQREVQHITVRKDPNKDAWREISLLVTLLGSNLKCSQMHKRYAAPSHRSINSKTLSSYFSSWQLGRYTTHSLI